MEKRVILAVVMSVLLLVGFQMATEPYRPKPPPPVTATGTVDGVGAPPPAGVDGNGNGNGNGGVPAPAVAGAGDGNAVPVPAVAPVTVEPNVVTEVTSERVWLLIGSHGASIRSARVWACAAHELNDPAAETDPSETTDFFDPAPGLLSVELLGVDVNLARRAWTSTHVEGADAAYTTDVPSLGVRLTKVFHLSHDPAQPYHVDMELRFTGLGTGDQGQMETVEIVGPWLRKSPHPLPEDGVLVALTGDDVDQLSAEDIHESKLENSAYEQRAPDGLSWVGARTDFHLGALLPLEPLPADSTVGFHTASRQEDAETRWASAAATIRVPIVLPTTGVSQSLRFRYYVGPNSRPLLTDTDSGYSALADGVPERAFIGLNFAPIERVLSWLLELIASTGMGYGLAIVCLTLCVRGVLFPLSRKSQISMRTHAKKMGALKPKMDAIKAKYKDPRKQQEMTMKLMRQEKVSLLPGGCLLTFLQMPIWISLYGVLQTTFEMRHASFLWAADLTAPDHLLHMPWFADVPLIPEWLNLFPLIMMVVWGISARMTPLPVDPNQQQQAKMMRWMPMLFGVFLYNFACGLTIYMTMSALWSIGEIQLIRRVWLKDL